VVLRIWWEVGMRLMSAEERGLLVVNGDATRDPF
jgi:hypothetical protein